MRSLFNRMSEGEGRLNKRSTAGIEREKKRLRERKKGWKRYMIKIREDLLPRKGMLGRDWRKKWWRDGGDGEGYFVIATNVSAVHCALQLQPAYTCLLWTLHYPSMPWSFRNRIIFFAVNRNYLSHNQISASKHSNWIFGFKNISHRGCFLRSSKLIQLLVIHH